MGGNANNLMVFATKIIKNLSELRRARAAAGLLVHK